MQAPGKKTAQQNDIPKMARLLEARSHGIRADKEILIKRMSVS